MKRTTPAKRKGPEQFGPRPSRDPAQVVPDLNEDEIHSAGTLQFKSIEHLLKLAEVWPKAAAGVLSLVAQMLKRNMPLDHELREYFIPRLLEASANPDRMPQIFGLTSKSTGRNALDNVPRNLRVVEVVRQLHEKGYDLRRDAPRGAYEAAAAYLASKGTPLSEPQIERIWQERKKYTI